MDLETLINEARAEGVTNQGNLPFLLCPEQPGSAAVLLVHGFTASPREMLPLAQHLVAHGFTCLAVRLPGHGVAAEKLAKTRMEDWLREVERGVSWLRESYPRTYGVGLSTGGLLMIPAAVQKNLAGLALLSPYLRLSHWLAPLAWLLRHVVRFQDRALAARDADFYTPRRPLAGVHQINRLVSRVRPLLPEVQVPTLVLSSAGDRTIRPDSARVLFNRLGAEQKNFHLYDERVPHVLTSPDNPHQLETLQRVSSFLLKLELQSASTTEP